VAATMVVGVAATMAKWEVPWVVGLELGQYGATNLWMQPCVALQKCWNH
jgi:hypothetical protein